MGILKGLDGLMGNHMRKQIMKWTPVLRRLFMAYGL